MNKLVLVSLAIGAAIFVQSAALARGGGGGGGHAGSPSQHTTTQNRGTNNNNNGPTTHGGVKSAAKINPLAGEVIGKKVLNGVIQGGRVLGGVAGSLGGAVSSGSGCRMCR